MLAPRMLGLGRMLGAAALLSLLLAPSLCLAQSADTAAKVVTAEGQVSVIRHEQEWALFEGDQVQVGETITTGEDGFAQLEVADGSSFLVYPDSRVVFRKNPGNLRDLIDVFLGRVKIYIQHLGSQPNPHRIYTPTAVISVRGTTFSVSVDDLETTIVSVDEGLVGVQHRLLPRNKETEVAAGQSLVIQSTVPLAESGVDGVRVAGVAEDIARVAASIWQRIGANRGGSGGSPGGGGNPGPNPLPGDEEAPPPPAPPPPPQ